MYNYGETTYGKEDGTGHGGTTKQDHEAVGKMLIRIIIVVVLIIIKMSIAQLYKVWC